MANATADIAGGIVQLGFLATSVAQHVTNSGTLNISADATANAYNTAVANAGVEWGVLQVGFGGAYASGTVNNMAGGNMTIAANANADGNAAFANAQVGGSPLAQGIGQLEIANVAHAYVTNDGTLTIGAIANANGNTYASANAFVDGIGQGVLGGDSGAASVDNAGTLDVDATAHAVAASGPAFAHAAVSYGISQNVDAFTAAANVNNALSGTIDIGAIAKATGTQAGAQFSLSLIHI